MCHIWILLATSLSFLQVFKDQLILSLHLQMLVVICHVNSLGLGKINLLSARLRSWNCLWGVNLTALSRWAFVCLIYHFLVSSQKIWILLNFFSLTSRWCPWSSLWLICNRALLLDQRLFNHNLLLLLSGVLPLMLIHDELLLLLLGTLICILNWCWSLSIWWASIIDRYH